MDRIDRRFNWVEDKLQQHNARFEILESKAQNIDRIDTFEALFSGFGVREACLYEIPTHQDIIHYILGQYFCIGQCK